jgi:GWxTD domain-containing protein
MSPEMRREVAGMRCVLTPAEFDILLALPYDGDRERWIHDYWELKDPVYTTAENEIEVEHYRRVAYAESAFYSAKWPMWDQRGEVYIRYGPPTFRQIVAPEVDQYGVSPEGEVWHYAQHNMTVLFEDPFSKREYSYYIERVRGPVGSRMRNIEGSIDAEVSGYLDDLSHVPPPSIEMEQAYDKYMGEIFRFYDMIERHPSVYAYDLQQNQVPFVFSVDKFRGGKWVDRVDVNIEFEADLTGSPYKSPTREYTATAVFWDTGHDETGRVARRFDLPVATRAATPVRIIPAQLVFSLPPGFYTMAVTVEEPESGKLSSYRTDVTCVDFESKLAISDILFASAVRPAERESPFNRGALEIVPHASRRYRKSVPIPVYFEVYNLARDKNDISTYTVEYQVVPHVQKSAGPSARESPGSRPGTASSFKMSGSGPHDVVDLRLELENLWAGAFDLRVTVTDDLSHAKATRVGAFQIVE